MFGKGVEDLKIQINTLASLKGLEDSRIQESQLFPGNHDPVRLLICQRFQGVEPSSVHCQPFLINPNITNPKGYFINP
jgi:hypothetical protein